jgi:hypothetical protein
LNETGIAGGVQVSGARNIYIYPFHKFLGTAPSINATEANAHRYSWTIGK